MGLILLWKMQRANFSWNCSSRGVPSQNRPVQALCTSWRNLAGAQASLKELRNETHEAKPRPAHPRLDSPKWRQLWQLQYGKLIICGIARNHYFGSTWRIYHIFLPASLDFVRAFTTVLTSAHMGMDQNVQHSEIWWFNAKKSLVLCPFAPGFPPSPPWSPGESSQPAKVWESIQSLDIFRYHSWNLNIL